MSSTPSPRPEPTVVGIGASAGGLAALKIFLNNVPSDCGLSFVVVVHLSPDHESHLAELLQPHVRFPVTQVTEDTALEPDHVYVIPPNANISTIDTHLHLTQLEQKRIERAPIDHFFRTLAATHDGHSIAVILTGTGSDGTLGIREVKANGGLVIVQDPNEAEYDGMPQNAIASGLVDLILPLKEIPEAILRYDRTTPQVPLSESDEATDAPTQERVILQKIFVLLRARTDRDFSGYKRSTVLRRIARRMQLNFLEDLSAYLERLRQRPEEVHSLADDLLVTVTNFFRDPDAFAKLCTDELPRIFANKGPQEIVRVWSVGCATGEEAYSLAIALIEEAAKHEAPPAIQIFASDLHTKSLDRAREGFYSSEIVADVSPERLKRYFQEENGGYRINKEVRNLIVFAPHNLLGDPPFSRLDLITCRNLLIYLEREVQHDVIEIFHYALTADGILLLGSAETIESTELFRVEDKKLCFYRKRNVAPREPRLPVFPLNRSHRSGETTVPGERPHNEPISYGGLHQHMVEQYAPPSILVNSENCIVHYSEHAGRYLIHPGGEPTTSSLKLVREELRIELQASLQIAREKRLTFDSRPIPVRFNGHANPVVMHVRPALETERDGYALVIFEERESQETDSLELANVPPESVERIRELEGGINFARQRLQTVIEEYETSREEMKASGEEMQSTNEELRSTLEELETSKEELQSINEELQTVNQQNRHKVEELAQLSSDLQNLLSATEIATLFLDRNQHILRFTPRLGDIFHIRLTDRGRPISDLTHRLGYDDLSADAQSVLSRLVPIEREVQDDAGRWYLTRVLPYRSTDDRIEGTVITFIDIDTRKRAEEALRRNEERLRRMINVESVFVMIFDAAGHLIDSNEAFRKMSGYSRAEVEARSFTRRDMTPSEYNPITEREMRKLAETGRIGPYEREFIRRDGSLVWMVFAGASLNDGAVVEYCIDIADHKKTETELRVAERNLRQTNEALTRANSDLKHFSYAVAHDMQEPLRMVTSYTQLLIADYEGKLDARADQYIAFAMEGANRMQSLFKDLLEYWSVGEERSGNSLVVECNAALDLSLSYLEKSVTETNALISRRPLPPVFAEQYPITLLFQNLLDNSIKYRRPGATPSIQISAEKNDRFWTFSVVDNGIGIEPEHKDTVFAPFKRLHSREYPGTGLGLAMCRKIVERYGGQIWALPRTDGATIQFTMPVIS